MLPEEFNGEGSWHQWIFHFENVAAVNEWNEDSCLRWMKVRLTGRAQTAFERFPQGVATDYKRTKEALREQFEPSSRREISSPVPNTKKKQRRMGRSVKQKRPKTA